jgi:hypothetical protein
MIQSTNAMMKGLVQGSDEAYADARKKYDQQFAEYKDQQKTWFDVYKAYQSAYKGRIDVDEKAITAANQAVGIAQTGTKMTRQQIMMLPEIAAKIEKTHADISHMSAQEMLAWARLNEKTQTDQAKQTDKTTRTTAKDAKKGEELTALNADIDKAIEMVQNNAMVTGAGGMVRRVGEVAGNVTGISSDTTAHDFESMISAIELKAAHAVSGDNRTAKDQRERIDKIVRGLKLGATKENTISSLRQLKEIISADGPAPQAALPTYTPEEAAKLPKGTKFTGTDGQTYTARGPQ